jgi:polysaccharide biosynthesis protein PslG
MARKPVRVRLRVWVRCGTMARMSFRKFWIALLAIVLAACASPDRSPTPDRTSTPTEASPTLRPAPSITPSPTSTPVPKPSIGVQGQFIGPDGDKGIEQVANLGVGWIKQQIDWNSIEYARGLYRWDEIDHLVRQAQQYHLKILFSVARAPGFSRPEPIEEDGPPSDFSIFHDFMNALASRYKGRVVAYELWNEPNLAREWRGLDLSAEKFVELIKQGAQGVREGDPNAIIISGAPAVTGIDDSINAIDDRKFLKAMIAAGVNDYVDAIGAHPYGAANPPDERAADPTHLRNSYNTHPSFFFLDTIEDYHQILSSANITQPIWITEFGWPSIEKFGNVDTTGWEYARDVTEQDQATYLLRAIQLGRQRSWIGPMIIWNLNVAPLLGPDRSESAYGLIRPNGSFRPAYKQLRSSGE